MKHVCSGSCMCLFRTKSFGLRKICLYGLVWQFELPLLTFLNCDGVGKKGNKDIM